MLIVFHTLTITLYDKSDSDIGRGIYSLSMVHTTNIYNEGSYTLALPHFTERYTLALQQSVGEHEYTSPHSESNYFDSIL